MQTKPTAAFREASVGLWNALWDELRMTTSKCTPLCAAATEAQGCGCGRPGQERTQHTSWRTDLYHQQGSKLTCVRDADNAVTYYSYDVLNRMTSVKNPFGEVTYYEYTPGGQVSKRTLGNSTLTYHEYDDVGRVSKVDNHPSPRLRAASREPPVGDLDLRVRA